MSSRVKQKASGRFKTAIKLAEHLVHERGLGALKKSEGKDRITQSKSTCVLGSVDIDGDCLKEYPNSSRWDYVIGIESQDCDTAVFVEVHSAETSEVKVIEKKLEWLFDRYLARDAQEPLRNLPRQIHWVASGRHNIPANTPQAR